MLLYTALYFNLVLLDTYLFGSKWKYQTSIRLKSRIPLLTSTQKTRQTDILENPNSRTHVELIHFPRYFYSLHVDIYIQPDVAGYII